MRSNTGGTGGGGVLIPPSVVTNIKTGIGNSVIKFSWTDPQDITAEGVVVNEWAGSVIVVNKDHKPVDQKDGDIIYTSTARNQHQTTPYTASGLDVGEKYFFAIFPFSIYGTYNTDQSQTGEVTVIDSPEVKPMNQYTWEEIDTISKMGNISENGNEWKIGDQVYFRLGDVSPKLPVTIKQESSEPEATFQIEFEVIGFKHDTLKNSNEKANISFLSVPTGGCSVMPFVDFTSGNQDYDIVPALNNAFKKLPENVKQIIKPVKKITYIPSYDGSKPKTTTYELWIPSSKELNAPSLYADDREGEVYPIFTDDKSRIKKSPKTNRVEYGYFTRSTKYKSYDSHYYIRYVTAAGSFDDFYIGAQTTLEFPIGFCI